MSEHTTCKYVVAGQYGNGIWNFYAGADDRQTAIKFYGDFCEANSDGKKYKAAAVFTRGQWHGARNTYRRHRNLRDRSDEPIPASLGMWLINQADSGYF